MDCLANNLCLVVTSITPCYTVYTVGLDVGVDVGLEVGLEVGVGVGFGVGVGSGVGPEVGSGVGSGVGSALSRSPRRRSAGAASLRVCASCAAAIKPLWSRPPPSPRRAEESS